MRIPRTPRRSGVTAVEVAVSLGVFFAILLGLFEYGRFLFVQHLVENATREGARQAVVGTNRLSTAQVQDVVRDWLMNQVDAAAVPDTAVEVLPAAGSTGAAWTDVPYGQGIMVRTTITYQPMFPTGFDIPIGSNKVSFRFLPDPVEIQATAIMHCEAN